MRASTYYRSAETQKSLSVRPSLFRAILPGAGFQTPTVMVLTSRQRYVTKTSPM